MPSNEPAGKHALRVASATALVMIGCCVNQFALEALIKSVAASLHQGAIPWVSRAVKSCLTGQTNQVESR